MNYIDQYSLAEDSSFRQFRLFFRQFSLDSLALSFIEIKW